MSGESRAVIVVRRTPRVVALVKADVKNPGSRGGVFRRSKTGKVAYGAGSSEPRRIRSIAPGMQALVDRKEAEVRSGRYSEDCPSCYHRRDHSDSEHQEEIAKTEKQRMYFRDTGPVAHGKTSSGKSIGDPSKVVQGAYASFGGLSHVQMHRMFPDWTAQDHRDAVEHHDAQAKRHGPYSRLHDSHSTAAMAHTIASTVPAAR